jgi:hypothetical protein
MKNMSEPGIRLSENYGVNPSIEQCYYCLRDKGVVLFGWLKGDAEAPRQVCLNMEPCNDCAKLMRQGIIVISIRNGEKPPAAGEMPNPHRTGGWCVVQEDAVRRILKKGRLLDTVLRRRFMFVEDEAYDRCGFPRGETVTDNE